MRSHADAYWELMKSQGMQENQQVVFMSDGGENVRRVQEYLHPFSEHLIDWFHITMRLTVLQQQTKALQDERPDTGAAVSKRLESVKHLLWHGNAEDPSPVTNPDEGPERGVGRGVPSLVPEVPASATNAGTSAKSGLTPGLLTLSVLGCWCYDGHCEPGTRNLRAGRPRHGRENHNAWAARSRGCVCDSGIGH
ncbi:MAG: hypothetical protein ACRD7E_14720 [Bryobacteraceae bacterium]